MLKKCIASALIAGAVLINAGMHHFDVGYSETVYTVTLHAGDTIESVSEPFYELSENGESYMAFRHRLFEKNKHMTQNGRKCQPGDQVKIPVMIADE